MNPLSIKYVCTLYIPNIKNEETTCRLMSSNQLQCVQSHARCSWYSRYQHICIMFEIYFTMTYTKGHLLVTICTMTTMFYL